MKSVVVVFGLAALAAGCATAPQIPPVENPAATWQLRQAQLRPITAW
ncbi:MAG: hypothetical protein HY274_05680, partial [Gammaproteobacteria bacterium]|nr:hypothetical protein [Gammaproteobacteria bacterium]